LVVQTGQISQFIKRLVFALEAGIPCMPRTAVLPALLLPLFLASVILPIAAAFSVAAAPAPLRRSMSSSVSAHGPAVAPSAAGERGGPVWSHFRARGFQRASSERPASVQRGLESGGLMAKWRCPAGTTPRRRSTRLSGTGGVAMCDAPPVGGGGAGGRGKVSLLRRIINVCPRQFLT
jgi:hypothetical protein